MSETLSQEMAPAFDPKPVEAKWGQFWLENEIGKPRQPKDGEKPFVITIPPPNVTGVLHLGHALQHSIHDCLLRYHRMKGVPTLCVPGTDHAGIATQVKVEAKIREEEGKTRHDLGREEFLRRVYEWKDLYGATIIDQMKALGCSYDWSRERFTMDEGYVRAVLTVFKEWFERGLIYRGYRLVNWSSGAHTTVSDLEIEYKEVTGSLTYIKYPVEGSEEFVTVATTRPETMLGDTAVAVHPEDPRYTHLRGKNVILPLQNRAIPLVFDEAVDKEFGTGAVKITPAHDPNDYEMGTRHGLPMISVIGFDDKITPEGGTYAGMDKIEARKKVVADLREQGLIEKAEPLVHSVGHCARTGVVIEPLLSEQWFVAMKELARPVADAIRMNRVAYHPQRFGNTSLEWLDNIRDWCISRQLWWGHRIPIWYGPNGEVKCSLEPVEEEGWTQDPDVLDTWFSSALWPFAVLGWPDQLEREWYPTSFLITGRIPDFVGEVARRLHLRITVGGFAILLGPTQRQRFAPILFDEATHRFFAHLSFGAIDEAHILSARRQLQQAVARRVGAIKVDEFHGVDSRPQAFAHAQAKYVLYGGVNQHIVKRNLGVVAFVFHEIQAGSDHARYPKVQNVASRD